MNNRDVHNQSTERGFTLMEISITLMVAGLIAAPALVYYQHYLESKKWNTTEDRVDKVQIALSTFRSVHGRYPCPMDMTVAPGGVGYGHEDCSMAQVPGANALAPSETVMSGALPFKILDLQEEDIYDQYTGRILYAVTSSLTDSDTFDPAVGAIGIEDGDGSSVVEPEGSGQFILVTFGPDKKGARSREGVSMGACDNPAVRKEGENCDGDAMFVSRDFGDDFSDRVAFFSGVTNDEWQVSLADTNDIHLRDISKNIAVGVSGDASDHLEGDVAPVEVREIDGIDGSGSIAVADAVRTSFLCQYDTPSKDGSAVSDKCFKPSLFAGTLSVGGDGTFEVSNVYDSSDGSVLAEGGEGISCGKDKFLVGIRNGHGVCTDEVYVACPEGQFVVGVNESRQLICSEKPLPCPETAVTTMCGRSYTLPEFYGAYHPVYSGEYYVLPSFSDSESFYDFLFLGDMYDAETDECNESVSLIDLDGDGPGGKTNYEKVQMVNKCLRYGGYISRDYVGPDTPDIGTSTADYGLVRDVYQCKNGDWYKEDGAVTPVVSHERLSVSGNFPDDLTEACDDLCND